MILESLGLRHRGMTSLEPRRYVSLHVRLFGYFKFQTPAPINLFNASSP